jgi:hypothetical protein
MQGFDKHAHEENHWQIDMQGAQEILWEFDWAVAIEMLSRGR